MLCSPPHPIDFDAATTWVAAGRAVVRVRGELDLASSPRLVEALADARSTGSVVELDLSGVTFVDCAGWSAVRPFLTGRTVIPRVRISAAVERLLGLLASADDRAA